VSVRRFTGGQCSGHPIAHKTTRLRFSNGAAFDILASVMRKLLSLGLSAAFLFVVTCFGEMHVEAKNWKQMQTYDVRTLAPVLGDHNRELVAVKFTFRGKDIRHQKPNWFECSLWQPDPKARKHFADVRVLVAKADLDAFKSITTESSSGQELTIYGTILRDFDSHFAFVRLIGRNVALDSAGNATVTW
jgi:hypothetical protein